jgi:pantoate--beta-alanine ligase
MYIFSHIETLQHFIGEKKKENSIGFCPTMGALHEGHLSLISASRTTCDITVASIFVNPTQFNDPEDLVKYPRNWSRDLKMLMDAGCDVVFLPIVEEIYPKQLNTQVKLEKEYMTRIMEGRFRPGHFDGMMQVVNRLLDIVQPDRLFMGQKDFQQQSIVREMISQLGLNVELVVCPIIREPDGLAMSSRNQRLGDEEREAALSISRALAYIQEKYKSESLPDLKTYAIEEMSKAGLKPEYVEFCDGYTLEIIDQLYGRDYIVCCIAAWAGDVRLIDNKMLGNRQA